MDMHAEVQYESDFRDAYLDDETENVTDIGKESIDGVEVEDVGECQDQKNPNETGVTEKICKCGLQSQEDLESPLGTSVSEIVCKCLEGTYDLSTPLSYKEKFGVQTCANQESFEAAREEAGVEYQEKSGVQSQDVENTEGTSRKSCELATEEHGEQLQDKENVQLEDKENDASNMLAELSVEKTQEGSVKKTVFLVEENNYEALNQYTRKRKRDSIGYDGPSFFILTPTPPSTQMSIDGGLSMELKEMLNKSLVEVKGTRSLVGS
ncbi:uncharacterized protein [Nicotiana sylvestris]|uniref:uncharacterized protein isoform X2 n=1 Tax=Nicotiana sylvestris TaxID=4096 RepID=UPI00388CE794